MCRVAVAFTAPRTIGFMEEEDRPLEGHERQHLGGLFQRRDRIEHLDHVGHAQRGEHRANFLVILVPMPMDRRGWEQRPPPRSFPGDGKS